MSPISDWLAPDLSPIEEFKCQYEMFLNYFTQQRENGVEICKCHIEGTNLTMILTKMCNLLMFEQAEICDPNGADSISTSIEYFLQNNIANILAVYAQADAPLGLCPIILLFFNKLIVDCNLNLMPHVSFHSAVNKLVTICGRINAGPYELYEIIFLQSLIQDIYNNREYINFFTSNDTFPLIDSLLSLLQSPDSDISTQAGECILKLLSCSNEFCLKVITERTPFCEIVISKVIQSYNEIPRNLNPHEIDVAMTVMQHLQFVNTTFSNAVRKYLSFLKWFMFYDSLIHHTNKESILSETLLNKIRTEFLESFVLSDLLGHGFDSFTDAIDNCFLTTVILLNCLKTNTSDSISYCIMKILTINDKKYFAYHPNVAKTLIQRCNLKVILNQDSSEFQQKQFKLASVTFQLFERILSKPFRYFVDRIVLKDLNEFYSNYSGEQNLMPESTDSYIKKLFTNEKIYNSIQEIHGTRKRPENFVYNSVEENKLEGILYYFYSLIPNEFRFGECSDYEGYAKEAIDAYNSTFPYIFDMKSLTNDGDEESLEFVDILLENVQFIPKLPHDIGVQLFSCLAKIAIIPDARIDAKLLDSTIKDSSKQTLFNSLFKLISELQISVSGIENLNQKLILIKKILLGEVKRKAEYSGTVDEQQILQSIIVIDEFCKEIAAISFVKQRIFHYL